MADTENENVASTQLRMGRRYTKMGVNCGAIKNENLWRATPQCISLPEIGPYICITSHD